MAADATVFVVDDDPALRDALSKLVASVGLGVETYSTAQEFLDQYDPAKPGCLILDVRMPGRSGLDLQKELTERESTLPIIILTGFADVHLAVRALKAGAMDFLEKPFSNQVLLDRIEEAVERDRRAREARARQTEFAARLAALTPREREVMVLVVGGKSNKEIAAALGLSLKTVEGHRAHVMEKTQVGSLAELVRLALMVEAARD
jgi:RNA polymerase sigma factor (sigma-70 family)